MMDRFCCDYLKRELEDGGARLGYEEVVRSFYIESRGSQYSEYRINFCPWCGNKLPKPLDDEYDREIAKILGKKVQDITIEDYSSPEIPEEFKADAWWKNRGL